MPRKHFYFRWADEALPASLKCGGTAALAAKGS